MSMKLFVVDLSDAEGWHKLATVNAESVEDAVAIGRSKGYGVLWVDMIEPFDSLAGATKAAPPAHSSPAATPISEKVRLKAIADETMQAYESAVATGESSDALLLEAATVIKTAPAEAQVREAEAVIESVQPRRHHNERGLLSKADKAKRAYESELARAEAAAV